MSQATADKKLRIALFHWPVADFNLDKPGGVLRVGIEEAIHLQKAGHVAHLYGIDRKGQMALTRNVRSYTFLGRYNRYASLGEFFLRTSRYDILHGFNMHTLIRRDPQRGLMAFHNTVPLIGYEAAKTTYQQAHFLFNAQHMYNDFRAQYPVIPEDHCFVLHNGVDHVRFSPRQVEPNADGKIRIGYVGAWNWEKGIHILIEIIHRLNQTENGSRIQWELAGGTSYWQLANKEARAIDAQIEALGKTYENVHLVGALNHEQLADFLSALDMMILPTQWNEPFGLTTIEAMSCGIPVIVSDVGGAKEIVRHNQEGFLVAKDDIDGFIRYILTLVDQPNLRDKLGKTARRTIEERFTWEIHTRELIEIYRQIDARKRSI